MKIHKLTPDVINKIAAGEVVERPASVVKELIENSLDAQATQITIELKNGGVDLIRVDDNGVGMTKEDALVALERHTTSKITSFDDVVHVATMGFRGEALASIASVSQFTMETIAQGETVGFRVDNVHGEQKTSSIARNAGTSITVGDLFYNVPARKKFLKTTNTEYQNCLDSIYQHTLMHPEVSWVVIHNDHEVLNAVRVTRLKDRIEQVLGKDLAGQMLEVNIPGDIRIEGYVGNPTTFRGAKKHQFMYVNHRPISDYMISKAVQDAYATLAQPSQYPAFVLHIQIPQEQVDVNTHPRKTEVKFVHANEVFKVVRSGVKSVLAQHNVLTATDLIHSFASKLNMPRYEKTGGTGFVFKPQDHSFSPSSGHSFNTRSLNTQKLNTSTPVSLHGGDALSNAQPYHHPFHVQTHAVGDWKLIGQVHASYLIVESPQGFFIIDQHAAAERVRYEKLLAEYHSTQKAQQRLLVPLTVSLDHRERAMLDSLRDYFLNIGFDIDAFGEDGVIVHAVPQDLIKVDASVLLKGILDDLADEHVDALKSLEEKQTVVVKYAACRYAIMFHDILSIEEQLQLIKDIRELDVSQRTCCHGRPFMKEITKHELEGAFHRH